MKKVSLLLFAALITCSVFAQAPEKMSYQAVIRDNNNALVTSSQVGIRIRILLGTSTGEAVYTETQTATTNTNGLVSLQIGTGITNDKFSSIDWSTGTYFIETSTDPKGGNNYSIIGASQLMSVPYALYAKTAGSCPTGPTVVVSNKSSANFIDFGTASNFAIFTVTGAVSNVGTTSLNGNVGANTGAITGFEAPSFINGSIHNTDAMTSQAAIDLVTVYNQLTAIPTTNATHVVTLGNGEIMTPGVYSIGGAASVNGILTLDGQGNSNAQFIFKIAGAFSTTANTQIQLTNGASATNIFWVTEGAISMAAATTMNGIMIANNAAISMAAGGTFNGRMYSTTGAIAINTMTALGIVYITPLEVETARAKAAELLNTQAILTEGTTARAAEVANMKAILAETARATANENLKENTANKNSDVNLGTSDVLFSTQNAVKVYVDKTALAGANALAAETTRAKGAEVANTTLINNENMRAINAEDTLATRLGNEATARAVAVSNEIARATTAEYTLTNNLTTESTRAKLGEKATADSLVVEINNRGTAIINLATSTTTNLNNSITTEASSRNAAIATNIASEVTSRNNAITTNINAEVANRTTAITNGIATEASSRDAAIATNITTEVTNRNAAIVVETNRATAAEALKAPSLSPILVSPSLGTPTVLVGTNITGTAAALTAGTVTTNANLTGDVTSVGNATTLSTTISNPGAFGGALAVPVITVDAKGRITAITTSTISATLQEDVVEVSATAGQNTFTLKNTPSAHALVRMYINGVLISQTAHTNSALTTTYVAASNGGYTLSSGDRIQLYYYY